jgi:hypothetical protein
MPRRQFGGQKYYIPPLENKRLLADSLAKKYEILEAAVRIARNQAL